ncbi:MAG: beta-propeller repeat-containing protein [Pedosphaera sp.]|nr:beta-propeller repeat-containing protein [Pedosphaera sp.]
MFKPRLLLFSAVFAFACSQSPAAWAGCKIVSHIKVGGEGGWDYLTADAKARRLYVSHGNEVVVINLDTEAVVARIDGMKGVHGIALAPELNRGFISNGQEGTVAVFALDTSKEIGSRIKTGQNPDAILYEPSTKRVFTFNGKSMDISVIDAAKGEVVGTIPVGGKPEFAVTDGHGTVWVNIEDKSEVVQFDAKTMLVKNHWPVAPGEEPSALAMDQANHRLFIGCGGNEKMVIMDAQTGKVVTSEPTGKGVDAAVYDAGTKRAFSSQGDGTMTVVHQDSPDKYTVEETVKTGPRARTMTIDSKTHKLYLPTAEFDPAPAATPDNPHPRPKMKPGTFQILVISQ